MRTWFPYVLGIGLAAVTCGLLVLVPRPQGLALLALLLAGIAWVYVGSALADGRGRMIALEALVALAFLVTAFAGLWYTPWALVVGYFAHGVWDPFHHPPGPKSLGAAVRARWYPPACLVYDWLVAAFVAVWYL